MRSKAPLAAVLAACLVLPLLSACGKSAPARFYSLTAPAPADTSPAGPCQSLGLGPVDLPAYLDRTQIVTWGDGNHMLMADFDQWIEPVQANFTRALGDSLRAFVCAEPLVGYPWPGGVRPDRQIAVTVRQFDGTLGREAVLRADWSIADREGKVLLWRTSSLRESCAAPGHAALVAAQSRLVERLARDMADALAGLPK